VAQTIKSPLVILETRVQFLGLEDALEKGMATHSSILACSDYGSAFLEGSLSGEVLGVM